MMTPQMEPDQPGYEQPDTAYGAYQTRREFSQQQYEAPFYQKSSHQTGAIDDRFVEALAQRIIKLMNQDSTGKVHEKSNRPLSGIRIAIGIVSLLLAAIAFLFLGIMALQLAQEYLFPWFLLVSIFFIFFVVNSIYQFYKAR